MFPCTVHSWRRALPLLFIPAPAKAVFESSSLRSISSVALIRFSIPPPEAEALFPCRYESRRSTKPSFEIPAPFGA